MIGNCFEDGNIFNMTFLDEKYLDSQSESRFKRAFASPTGSLDTLRIRYEEIQK